MELLNSLFSTLFDLLIGILILIIIAFIATTISNSNLRNKKDSNFGYLYERNSIGSFLRHHLIMLKPTRSPIGKLLINDLNEFSRCYFPANNKEDMKDIYFQIRDFFASTFFAENSYNTVTKRHKFIYNILIEKIKLETLKDINSCNNELEVLCRRRIFLLQQIIEDAVEKEFIDLDNGLKLIAFLNQKYRETFTRFT